MVEREIERIIGKIVSAVSSSPSTKTMYSDFAAVADRDGMCSPPTVTASEV